MAIELLLSSPRALPHRADVQEGTDSEVLVCYPRISDFERERSPSASLFVLAPEAGNNQATPQETLSARWYRTGGVLWRDIRSIIQSGSRFRRAQMHRVADGLNGDTYTLRATRCFLRSCGA